MKARYIMGTSKNSFWAASGLIFLWTASQKTVNIYKYARFFVTCQKKIILAFASKAIIRGTLIIYSVLCFLFIVSNVSGVTVESGEFTKIYDPSAGEKNDWYINDHCFIRGRDGIWHLFGITHAEPLDPMDEDNLAHATAGALTQCPWRKQPFALSVEPVWNEIHLWAPHVIEHEGVYYMYYCAGDTNHTKYKIHLAISHDLTNWERHPDNPVIVDGFDARDPYIFRHEDGWIMYYTATSDPVKGNHIVACQISNDLIHWSDRRVVFVDPSIGTWGGPTESPTVIRRGDSYYLFIGPRDHYQGTCIYRSSNPFHWEIDDLAGQINAHAAEVIRCGQGNWYVSHCGWGQGGVYLAPLIWNDDLNNTDTSLQPGNGIRLTEKADRADMVRLPMTEYRDKMMAGWLGQMVGVAWGFPVEFKYLGQMIPENKVPQWKPDMINDAFEQDDLYVEMTFLRTLQQYGFDVSGRQAGIDFANTLYPLWHANNAGRINLRQGVAPPDSGHPRYNSHADDIDYQIEADFAGLISPALGNHAIELGNTFGRIVNYGDGLYGGQFVAAMYSLAFIEKEPEKIITGALDYIPKDSQYAQAICDVLKWYREYPQDWTRTWELIDQKYQRNPDYRKFSCDRGKFNIDAKINGAYIVMGLLYGEKDIAKTIQISMRCGQDADCNPSNAAGILFATIGYQKLPAIYKAFDPDRQFIHTPYDLLNLFDVCETLARLSVYRLGGYTESDGAGNEILVIPQLQPKPNPLEESFQPGPVADSHYSMAEMAKIINGLQLTGGPVAPGWMIKNCGADMAPGYYKGFNGRTDVLVTHPLDQDTGCSLSKEIPIPKDGKTSLLLTVGHHAQGDWVLIVKANGKIILKKEVDAKNAPDGYMNIEVELSAYAGQKILLEIINQPNGWAWEGGYWDRIEVVTR